MVVDPPNEHVAKMVAEWSSSPQTNMSPRIENPPLSGNINSNLGHRNDIFGTSGNTTATTMVFETMIHGIATQT